MAKQEEQQFQVNLNPEKTPIMYSDTIFMSVNDDGVTFDVCQKVGNSSQVQVVSRIGMSREHAQKFVKKLSEILALTHGHSRTTDRN